MSGARAGNKTEYCAVPGEKRGTGKEACPDRDKQLHLDYVNALPLGLLCVFCTQVVELPCGKRAHPHCFKSIDARSAGAAAVCPSCGVKIDSKQVFRDAWVEQELGELMVYCPGRCSGCIWTGPRNAVEERKVHVEDAQFVGRPDRQKGKMPTWKPLTSEGEQVVTIRGVNERLLDIQRTLASMPASAEERLAQMCARNEPMQQELKETERRMATTEEEMRHFRDPQIKMSEKIEEACSQSLDNIHRETDNRLAGINQYLTTIQGKTDKMEAMLTRNGHRIERQLESPSESHRQRSDSVSTTQRQQFAAQDRVLAVHDIKLTEHSLRLNMMDCKNTDGVLLWKITEIRRRRRDAQSGKIVSIYSQPFYSSSCGYKMCARLYLNGDGMGKGSHISLFFVLMRGEYDSLLSWPFRQKVTLVLVDQEGCRNVTDAFRPDPNSSSFQRPRTEMNVASGCPLFVPLAVLESEGYIKDDAIFVKMIVDTSGLARPDGR